MKQGQRAKATECFQSSVDVTPEMAFQLIKVLFIDLGFEEREYRICGGSL